MTGDEHKLFLHIITVFQSSVIERKKLLHVMNGKRKLSCARYRWTRPIWPFVMPAGHFI